jgi:hypothetical protein
VTTLASAIVGDKKYEETKYRHKKEAVDTSDIIIEIGNKLFVEDIYYGEIIRESELFYYIQTHFTEEPVEFQKTSILDKLSNKKLRLVD